jgi:cell division protein FtsZ
MIELETNLELTTRIAVVGVGGAGCNAIKNLVEFGISGVDLIAINTDSKQLQNNPAPVKLVIGKTKTRGQGAGANPEVGRMAAEEDYQSIVDLLKGKDMVFITAGMGKGTGTGAAPVVAKAIKEHINDANKDDAPIVVGIVITPLENEGPIRKKNAIEGLEELRKNVDGLIIVSNEKLAKLSSEQKLPVGQAYKLADKIVFDAAKGIVDLINHTGSVNIDFRDFKTVIRGMGDAFISKGTGEGEKQVIQAVENALNSPLLEGIDLRNAKHALVNIYHHPQEFLGSELDNMLAKIHEATNKDLNIIYGLVEDESLSGSINITLVITGFTNSFIETNVKKLQKTTPIVPPIPSNESDFVAAKSLTPDEGSLFESENTRKAGSHILANFDPSDINSPAYLRRVHQRNIYQPSTPNFEHDVPQHFIVKPENGEDKFYNENNHNNSSPASLIRLMD